MVGVRDRVAVLIVLALVSGGVSGLRPAAEAAQFAQYVAPPDAKDAEFDAQRARDQEKEEARDDDEQDRKNLRLDREQTERGGLADEAEQRRTERKSRLKELIGK